MFCPYEIDSFSEQQTDCNISLKPNDKKKSKIELTSQLLIAASGADSGLHKLLGINSNVVNYHQDAIIGNVMTAIPIENRAFERFYSEGSIAFLPLANNRSAFIWILPNHKSEIMMNASNNEFLEMLQKEFGLRLGKMSNGSSLAASMIAPALSILIISAAKTKRPPFMREVLSRRFAPLDGA